MPTLEQVTEARLAEIRDIARSGFTELTGKVRREGGHEGKIIGRYGGMKGALFPELVQLSEGPKVIAKAIDRGKGIVYRRVREAVERMLAKEGFRPARKRSPGKPVIPSHPGNAYCKHCRAYHSSGQHRFHGEGAFHRTHLFSFNPPMTVTEAKKEFTYLMWLAKNKIGKLTVDERARLIKARQVLRRAKQPAMNPPPRRKYFPRPFVISRAEKARTTRAYKKAMKRFGYGKAKSNPGESKIYGNVLEIICQRVGPHRCDAACKRVNHRYRHVFKSHPSIYGRPDGSLVIR